MRRLNLYFAKIDEPSSEKNKYAYYHEIDVEGTAAYNTGLNKEYFAGYLEGAVTNSCWKLMLVNGIPEHLLDQFKKYTLKPVDKKTLKRILTKAMQIEYSHLLKS